MNNNDALDTVMKDDGLGFGNLVACCPICDEPFQLPFSILLGFHKPVAYPCKHCGQLLKVPFRARIAKP